MRHFVKKTDTPGPDGPTALVFVVVQILQDRFVSQKIMGKVTGLNPGLMMLSLSVWG